MSTKFSLNNRAKIGFSFAIVFLLVFATNRLDKRRFDTVSDALTSVYEDRLVAKGYLYQLSNIFHEQEKLLMQNSENEVSKTYHKMVNTTIEAYKNTKLTTAERTAFSNFQRHFNELQTLELSASQSNSDSYKANIIRQISRIQNDLDNLAQIQLDEGESLTKFAQSSLKTSSTYSQIEIAIIILIGIIVQFIIFYK
jgi:hypothetical protein